MFRPRSRRGFRAAGFLLALFLLAFAPPSHALKVLCVGTSQELTSALGEANALWNADSAVYIRLRPGQYVNNLPSLEHAFHLAPNRSNQTVKLSGGWSQDCQIQHYGSPRTVLIGTAERRALEFRLDNGNHTGNRLFINDLDLQNMVFDLPEDNVAACLAGALGPGNEATIERLAMRHCYATYGESASILIFNRGKLVLRNIAVNGGVAKNNGGISLFTFDHGVSHLAQISVTNTRALNPGNSPAVSGIALMSQDFAVTHLSNSVTWGNDVAGGAADLFLHGPGITLTRVHRGKLNAMGGAPADDIAPGTGSPGFVAVGDAHPRPDSILIDSGLYSPVGGAGSWDVEGNPRKRGATTDVGAYEAPVADVIFRNGFDQGLQ